MKIWAQSRQDREMEQSYIIRSSLAQDKIYRSAREYQGGWGFSWTRRFIAIVAVLFIIVWPKVAPVLSPETPVIVSTPIYYKGGWLWSETMSYYDFTWKEGAIFLTPLDTNLMVAIIGLFFGSEITKRR